MIAVVNMTLVDETSARVEFSDDSVEVIPVSIENRMFEADASGLEDESKQRAVDVWVNRFGPPRSMYVE